MRTLLVFPLLLLCIGLQCRAQGEDDFEYEGTTITGVKMASWSKEELSIPAGVTAVAEGAFANSYVSDLTVEGADVSFSPGAFEDMRGTLTNVNMGSGMSEANMKSLVLAVKGHLDVIATIEIEGFDNLSDGDIQWTVPDPDDDELDEDAREEMEALCGVLTDRIKIILPAALVGTQQFGDAKVYGRFTLKSELATFCGSQTFQDTDDGSNMLFYVATELQDNAGKKQVYMKRVHYVMANKGVLIHNNKETSSTAVIPRCSEDEIEDENEYEMYQADEETYGKTMLVGVTEATEIQATYGDKTNLILYQGAFYPTSGGRLSANRAYLQIPTSSLSGKADGKLSVSFEENEKTGIVTVNDGRDAACRVGSPAASWNYNLSGQRVNKACRGITIRQGRKIVNLK